VENSNAFREIKKYWTCFLKDINEGKNKKIAITSGPYWRSDNWFLFYVLGDKFQNEIVYIPISKSGKVIDFDKEKNINKDTDYNKWIERLKKEKVTHILSFIPKSVELEWMERNKDVFKFLSGEKGKYGLFYFKDK